MKSASEKQQVVSSHIHCCHSLSGAGFHPHSGLNPSLKPLFLLALAFLATQPSIVLSQSLTSSEGPSSASAIAAPAQPELIYERPTQQTMLRNYLFDAYGPYPFVGAAVASGINQWTNSPPEWGQGAQGYGKRFGSDFGIAAIGTTARYGLAQSMKEDTLYYRCECTGFLHRTTHALLSTFTARRGSDGHRVFSVASLVSPYAGNMAAVYGWYPGRFGAKDAFRMGNYNLLAYAGANVALEFFYSGPHSLLARTHLNNTHDSSIEGPNK